MKETFNIEDMTCNNCVKHIEDALKKHVTSVKANFVKGTAVVNYNEKKISRKEIIKKIKESGYDLEDESSKKSKALHWHIAILSIFVLIAIYAILRKFGVELRLPDLNFSFLSEQASFILLFLAGLLTGFHCIAMCGGFLVSYTAKNAINGHKSFKQHLIYGTSKTISYTIVGAIFGLIGSIFLFSPALRGGIAIFAGVFMMFYAFSMFGLKFFRRFQFNPKFLTKIAMKKHPGFYRGPMITGLLNGLFIACGPLQALYLYAAGTGSMIQGGLSLMVFGLGTLPVMLGFGGFANIISHKATKKILKISAIVVLILGIIMLNRGLALTGSGYDIKSIAAGVTSTGVRANVIIDEQGYQIIEMEVNRYGWTPDEFVLKKDVPVKWVINGKEINGCNNAIQIPKLGLNFDIKKGEQIIEFTPTKKGVISWSCWMGMIPGTFIVTDDGTATDKELEAANSAEPIAGSCGASGGGCGCGGGR
ncbi:hypothetical protein HOD29_06120 [archaeon]|jgi:uncharacterized protein|nr:hypothetical protein [archaeon]